MVLSVPGGINIFKLLWLNISIITRDFVYGCKTLVSGNKMVVGGLSVTVTEQPEVKGFVRAQHGAGCQIVVDTGASDK